jgi:hypothetical protein
VHLCSVCNLAIAFFEETIEVDEGSVDDWLGNLRMSNDSLETVHNCLSASRCNVEGGPKLLDKIE